MNNIIKKSDVGKTLGKRKKHRIIEKQKHNDNKPLGCNTFAPKYASSMASSYDKKGKTTAFGTRLGSADKTPLTSVQISTEVALRRRPKMVAE